MTRAIFSIFVFVMAGTIEATPGAKCSSDYSCSYGEACLKAQYSTQGVCATKVDSHGLKTYGGPSTNSVGVKMDDSDMCQFTTDCSVGFKCIKKSGSLKGYCMK